MTSNMVTEAKESGFKDEGSLPKKRNADGNSSERNEWVWVGFWKVLRWAVKLYRGQIMWRAIDNKDIGLLIWDDKWSELDICLW